jgi:DNA-binding transcriptional LysR family regulator
VVEEGADLVIRIASELPDSATLVAQKLARARHVVCASPAYLAEHGAPETPEDLAAHECIVYSLGRAPGAWTFQGPDGPSRIHVRGRLRVNNSVVIREAARRGAGIALLPSFYVGEELERGQLVRVLADHELPPLIVHAVHPRSKHVAARVRVVVELLKERFSKSDWAVR